MRKARFWMWAGLSLVLLSVVPCLLLGENAVFTWHDQLDGEVIAYCLQARHLFSGDILPEFLGGASRTALTPPAPAGVLCFLSGNAWLGLVLLLLMGKVFGFLGMYLLAEEVTGDSKASAAAGVLYGWMPFLPVYGLSQFGIPLLFWFALRLQKGKNRVGAYVYTVFFALNSSLVLVGFGILGLGLIWLICQFLRNREAFLGTLACWLLLLVVYVAENARLLAQVLGLTGDFTSHKAEYALSAESFPGLFLEYLTKGGQHSEDWHLVLAAVSAAALVLAVCLLKKDAQGGKLQKTMAAALGCNLLFAAAAALWDSAPGISLRTHLEALGAFQFDRLLWIAPCLWMLFAACGLALSAQLWKKTRLSGGAAVLLMAIAFLYTGGQLLLNSDVKSNVQKLRDPDYGMMSFSDYYAQDVMEQVEEYLRDERGQEPEDYRVASLGIDPAAALYHGFYCLDGYSNNYSLEYKHAFRKILEPELNKSAYLKAYFDDWGNRCYLFSSECPGYYTIEKNGFYFSDYELDTDAFSELGGDYLLSAAYIANAEEQGLSLVRQEPFETESSYYRIFLYEVSKNP